MDSPILKEGFRLNINITLCHLRAEQKEGGQKIEASMLFSITEKRLIGLRQGLDNKSS